ncbi:MAG TPA: hypothetical protein VF952_01955 [Chloroflexia bacterium]|jgi:hypothetical protein
MNELASRLDYLRERLRTAYDGIGHSSGRPFVYFVYPPEQERAMRRMAEESLHDDLALHFHWIDLLDLTITTLQGQEERRQELLNDSAKGSSAAEAITRLWARALAKAMLASAGAPSRPGRPVVVLKGLAALHPLANPTTLMEQVAEQEPRDPLTNQMIPIVLLVPGVRPPQTSRCYHFLGLDHLRHDFYRGEEA